MSTTVRTPFAAGLVLACASLLAACAGSAPAGSAPVAPASPAPSAVAPIASSPAGSGPIGVVDPTPVPIGSAPSSPGTDPGGLVPGGDTSGSGTSSGGSGGNIGSGGGSVPGNPGGGVVTNPPNDGGGPVPDPQPTIVSPVAGLLGIHAVGAARLEPGVNGTNLSVRVSWWSGVEPCAVLSGVTVARDGNTFKLTVTEGSKGQGVACVDIAMYKATIVDLGKVDPGTYTISAFGDAPFAKADVKG